MDTARWERIQEIFHAAADLPAGDRPAFLRAECGDDADLQAAVTAMLDADTRGASLLDRDLGEVAREVLDDDSPAVPARMFGPYRPVSFLGEGGMGVVYLAERPDLGSTVALKVLRDATLSPARRRRFQAEQRTLSRFDHPLIARLLDAGALEDGTPWIAMEYVDGVPLTEHCEARAANVDERLRLFRDVCLAVRDAHRHAVIHRDLKPSNILVCSDGTIKLLDFGIAKSLDALDYESERTRTVWRMVTPAYAAPEQEQGGPLGVYTDVFALGVILYELLAGALPEGDPQDTPPSAAARRAGRRLSLSRAAWGDLDGLCLTALQEDPARRYATVDAMIRDVDHYRAGEPLEARPNRLGYRAGKFVRRHRLPLTAAAAVFVTVTALVAFYGARLTGARNDAVAEAERAQRIQRFMLSLFEGGDDEAAPPESLRVVTLLDRGAQQARLLDGEPAVQAELLQTLGEVQLELGRLGPAESLLTAADARRRAALGAEHPDVARGMVSLSLLRLSQADYEEAERSARQALDLTRRLHPPGHPDVLQPMVTLGQVLSERGRYDEATALLEEAVALRGPSPGEDLSLASALYELANAHFYAGRYDASDSLNLRVLDIERRLLGDRHPSIADNLVNLGAVRAQLGRPEEAERSYREALAITRDWYGDDHPKTATNRTMLGRALVAQERTDEALAELTEALAVLERVHGPVHPRVASALNELGIVALQHDRLDEAEAYFLRMADIYRRTYGDDHDFLGVALSNVASVHMAKQDWAAAEAELRDVVARFARTLSEEHINTGVARIKHGRTLLRLDRRAEAREETAAGLAVLAALGDSTSSWVRAAREDQAAAE